jgi:hypothetical protein
VNLKTGIIAILFCVALAAVIVGQRVQTRSVGFEAAQHSRELRELQEQYRVLKSERARKGDPVEMIRRVREEGIKLLPPEDGLPEIPGKPAPVTPEDEVRRG